MMTIRVADLQDLNSLATLFEKYRKFYRKAPDYNNSRCFLEERMTLNESIIYVAELEDELIGFTQLYPIFSSTNLKKAWLLNDLFVNDNQRGKGISKKLIQKAQELAKDTNAHGIMLETEKTNDIGNRLYPKAGFKACNDVNFYEWRNPMCL